MALAKTFNVSILDLFAEPGPYEVVVRRYVSNGCPDGRKLRGMIRT